MLQSLREHGLIVEEINNSGELVRCATVDKPRKKNGCYCVLPDGESAWWMNWATGDSGVIPKGKRQTSKDRRKIDEIRAKITEERERKAECTAERAAHILSRCHIVQNSPYLTTKGVLPFGIYQYSENYIIIPMRDASGKLWSLQSISGDGRKKFMAGGKKKGCFHRIEGDSTVLLCEGYATGASIHMATGHTVIVCFDCGNMQEVAKDFHDAAVCADNDVNEAGVKAAKATGLHVYLPCKLEGKSTDFNDLHQARGLDAVRACFKTPQELLSDSVFESILAIVDPVGRERAMINARELATNAGKGKEFEQLLKAHRARRKNAEHRKTDFGNGEALECGAWIADEDGIFTQSLNGDQWASRTPIYPVKKLKNLQTGKEKITLRYKLEDGWHDASFDRSVVASANKIMALTDLGVNFTSENAKTLVRYLSEVEAWNPLEKLESTSKLGWHEANKTFIPYTDTKVLLDSEKSFSSILDSLTPHGDKDAYLAFLKASLATGHKEITMLVAASLASVLVEPVGGLPFMVHLYGQAGRGKTLSTMLAASVWGKPTDGGYMADPKNTSTSFEVTLDLLNNLPFICDDTNKIAKTGQQDFSQLIYLLCSGSGKQRSNLNLGMEKLKRWCNVSITNGEKSVVTDRSHGGELLRVIEIEMDDVTLFEDGHATAEFLRSNYGFLGRMFVEEVQRLGWSEVKKIHKAYAEWLVRRDSAGKKEGKQLQSVAFMLTAAFIVSRVLGLQQSFLDSEFMFNAIRDVDDVSDVRRAYAYICDTITQNHSSFRDSVGGYEPLVRWGWERDDGTMVIVPSQLGKLCSEANVDKRLFIAWCLKEGKIPKHDKKDGTYTFRIDGKTRRLVQLVVDAE